MNRTAMGSAAGAVLIGALLLRGPAPAPRGPTQTPRASMQSGAPKAHPKAAKAKKEIPEDGPWKPSQDYFGPARSDVEECSAEAAAAGQTDKISINTLRDRLWCVPHNVTVQAMIAIVPDPVHTRLPLVFDRSIEAIQLAAQSMNYVADRYWLPWNPQGTPEWNNYDSRKKAEEDAETREEQPGLLMFRWTGKPEDAIAQVLYVFVVAETPTTGINGRQFRNAAEYVQTLCWNAGAAGCSDWDRIRVLGPSFSGSLDSFVRLTRAVKQPLNDAQQPFT